MVKEKVLAFGSSLQKYLAPANFAVDDHSVQQVLQNIIPQRYRRFVPRRFQKYFPEEKSRNLSKMLFTTGTILVIIGILVFTVVETNLYVQSLRNLELTQAQRHAHNARPVVELLSLVTFYKVPDIEAWKYALLLGKQLGEVQALSASLSQNLAQLSILTQPAQATQLTQSEEPTALTTGDPFIPTITALSDTTQHLQQNIAASFFAKRMISPDKLATLNQATQVLTQLEPLAQTVFTGKQTWVVVFQNSDELRAGGGFSGSYALVTLQDGQLSDITVEDIYDADGQFSGYLPAPAGMREYTSSSRGLRLPDANWFPHFPQSAQIMLQFFAFGNKKDIKGIITVNLPVAEAILKITGPLPIPDYDTSVTAENLHTVLREERDDFFPGSNQKKHILSQAMTVLRQKLTDLPPAQQLAIFKELLNSTTHKEIQAYAINPDLELLLSSYGVTGELGMNELQKKQYQASCPQNCATDTTLVYLVESNVGINKANRFITRSTTFRERDGLPVISVEFRNTASKTSKTLLTPDVGAVVNPAIQIANNGYANYQRLLISPDFTLKSAIFNGKKIELIDVDELTYEHVAVTQYGFLTIVLPEQTATLELTLEPTSPGAKITDKPLFIQKQSGLMPSSYTFRLPDYKNSFILAKDHLVTWK